jgi:heat shock protein HslJ
VRHHLLFVAVGLFVAIAVMLGWEFWQGRTFPLNQRYIVATVNGQRFDDRSINLLLGRGPQGYSISAYAGCNHFGANVIFLVAGMYVIRGSWMTAMYCTDRHEVEKQYFDALLRTNHWRITEGQLILRGLSDVLRFDAEKKEELD